MLKYTSPFMRPCDPGSETFTYAIFNDTKANNTAGGTFTTGAWRTRDLNTEVYNSIVGALLGAPGDILLLHMNGADDGTTFIDSTGRHTVTREGDTKTKIDQRKFGTASAYFDGTGDYLSIPNSGDFNFGDQDFTIDMWVRLNGTGASHTFWCHGTNASNYAQLNWNGSQWRFSVAVGNSIQLQILATDTISSNTWYHVAVVRRGNDWRIYRDGVSKNYVTQTYTYPTYTSICVLGALVVGAGVQNPFAGYIDEFRISKGIARWTSNFTPPDEPYGMTSLLLHMNGDDSGTTFTDDSGQGHVVTAYGTAQTKTAQKVFGTSSVYVTQTPVNSYLGIPASSNFNFGTGDFTIDFRARFDAMTGNPVLLDLERYTVGVAITYYNNQLYCHVAGTLRAFSWTPSLDTWYHIVLTRASGVLRAFIDGIQIGSPLADTGNVVCTTNGIRIGFHWGGGGYIGFQGYIDEVRICKGISKWTGGFIVPSNAQGDTSLLLHMDDEGSVEFVDSSGNDHEITAVGNVTLSETEYKFGGSSAYFDGVGDRLVIPNSGDFAFGTADFTVDCWIMLDADAAGYNTIISNAVYGGGGFRIIYDKNNNRFVINVGTSSQHQDFFANVSGGLTAETWYHIALVRYGSSNKFYLNGTEIGSHTGVLSTTSSINLAIGMWYYSYDGTWNSSFKGYIDEVRIVKGEAKWTSNFTPPTSAYTYTALLLHMDGSDSATTFTDSSERKHSVTAAGNTQTKTDQKKFGTASAALLTAGDYLSIPTSPDFTFAGDFTIDGWFYTAVGSNAGLIDSGYYTGAGTGWGLYSQPASFFFGTGSDSDIDLSAIGARTTGAWQHVAVTRKDGVVRMFVDGVLKSSQEGKTNTVTVGSALWIGRGVHTAQQYNGYIDELRIVKGVALWNQDFTVPTSEYTVDYSDYGLNQFTLPAGSYLIKASAPASDCNHKCKLFNVSDAEDVNGCIGSSEDSLSSGSINGRSIIEGAFTVEATKIFEIQHRGSATVSNTGLGIPVNLGVDEIYTQVKVTKIA